MAVCLLGSNFVCEWNGLPNGWSTSRMMHATCRLYEIKCIAHAIRLVLSRLSRGCALSPKFNWKSIYLWQNEKKKRRNNSFSWVQVDECCCARNKTSAFSVCLQLSIGRQMMPTTWSFQFVLYDDFSWNGLMRHKVVFKFQINNKHIYWNNFQHQHNATAQKMFISWHARYRYETTTFFNSFKLIFITNSYATNHWIPIHPFWYFSSSKMDWMMKNGIRCAYGTKCRDMDFFSANERAAVRHRHVC